MTKNTVKKTLQVNFYHEKENFHDAIGVTNKQRRAVTKRYIELLKVADSYSGSKKVTYSHFVQFALDNFEGEECVYALFLSNAIVAMKQFMPPVFAMVNEAMAQAVKEQTGAEVRMRAENVEEIVDKLIELSYEKMIEQAIDDDEPDMDEEELIDEETDKKLAEVRGVIN